jgi:hypothetical protein
MSDINEFALRGIRAEIERLQALEKQLQRGGRKGGQISVTPSSQRGAQVAGGRGGTVIGSGRAGGGGGGNYMAAVPEKRKRKMSAAGRKAIGDAARRRWAKVRTQKAEAGTAKAKGGKKR